MSSDDRLRVAVASLTNWGVIALRCRLHLVGVLLGGHPKMPDGVWLISSPVLLLNDTRTLAITASSGRFYELRRQFKGAAWPEEAMELITRAMAKWHVTGEPPTAPIPWDALPSELARRGLDGTTDPSRGPAKLERARAALVAGLRGDGSRPMASLAHWATIEIQGELYLVGILRGGHDRLPSNRWIVTSPLWFLDPEAGTAITTSTGRHYRLSDPLPGSLPDEARLNIASVMAQWGLEGTPPSQTLLGPALHAEIFKRGLDGTTELLGTTRVAAGPESEP